MAALASLVGLASPVFAPRAAWADPCAALVSRSLLVLRHEGASARFTQLSDLAVRTCASELSLVDAAYAFRRSEECYVKHSAPRPGTASSSAPAPRDKELRDYCIVLSLGDYFSLSNR